MSVWLREVTQEATGWIEAAPALDICFDHEGKWYGLRVLLSGPHSPWGRKLGMSPAEIRKEAGELLARSVRATRWALNNPDKSLDAFAPADVVEVFEKGTPAVQFDPPRARPRVGWTRYAGDALKTFEDEMRVRGWEPQ